MEERMNYLPLICTLVGAAGVLFSIIIAVMVKRAPAGNEKMQEIANAIKEGAIAYLNRQLKSMGIAGAIIFVIIIFALGVKTALGFLLGAVASFLAGYIGMRVSVIANVRTAEASKGGLAQGLSMAFKGGSVTGMIVAGLALTSVAGYYTILISMGTSSRDAVIALVALGFGGSLISIFARLGGGIFTKGADVGADLVGKVEAGIPEDDPRNPATIADNVGDNVGDCAGMAADLFETYAVTAVAAMLLGNLIFPQIGIATEFPLVLGAISIVASMIAVFFVRLGKSEYIMGALYWGMFGAAILAGILEDLVFHPGGSGADRFDRCHHGILHGDSQPGKIDSQCIDHRTRHQYYCRPRGQHAVHRCAGAGHLRRNRSCPLFCRALRHCHGSHVHALDDRDGDRHRCLWSDYRQRRRYCRNGGNG
jgi:K(+)-stimulated pyrophosphate-energized sodium pump